MGKWWLGNRNQNQAKGTRLVARIAKPKRKQKRAPRVRLGAPDGRVTPRAGLHLVAKLDQLLGISSLDSHVGFTG